jgi:membrane-bound metal-dependent hydrolase YbcI (DUF457 family)
MFIFTHIFAGAVLGLVLGWFLHDTRIIPLCIAASILSDVIDKPLGFILLPDELGPGRTFFHALLAVILIVAIAFLVWRFRGSILLFIAAGSVMLHQLLDAMWHEPVNWFYPLLGPFQPYHDINYFKTFFWLEVSSASEWVFFFATIVIFSHMYIDRITLPLPQWITQRTMPARYAVLLLLVFTGLYSLWSGSTGTLNMMTPYNTPENNLIMGIVALAGFSILVAFMNAKSRAVD